MLLLAAPTPARAIAAAVLARAEAPQATCAAATKAAISAAVRAGLEGLRARPPIGLAEWSAQHFRLAGESSHQRGGWEAWPFQLGILDWMGDDDIEELDVLKSKRVGYTKMLTAAICFDAAYRRRNQAIYQPTDDDRDSFVKSEIDPAFDGIPVVAAARKVTRAAEDSLKLKHFRGCVVHLLGGKAARAYRRITVASVKLDELSGFDPQIEKSADPFTLAHGRLEGAPFPKAICGSTPRIKGLDLTEARAALADAFLRYHIACPHCRAEHPLAWGGKDSAWGIKWDPVDPAGTVRHVCPHCRQGITQAQYLAAWAGTWVCDKTGIRYGPDRTWRAADGQPVKPPRHVACHVWTAYSPQRDWPDIVRQFLAARERQKAGDEGPMQGFVNETRGETWEVVGARSDEHALQKRAEPFPLRVVPVGALKLTAGIDLQADRWEIHVWGWGRRMESWPIDHHVIDGNPASEADWAHVAAYLARRYPQAWHGGHLGIDSVSIDSGFHTHAVYHFVRNHQHRLPVRAIKGDPGEHKPIKSPATAQDVNWRGQRWANGIRLWIIGVHQAKDLLLGQLAVHEPGPGYVHFSHELPREWYEQLTAEQRIPVRSPRGGELYRWIKRRPRNEVLDGRNYAYHAATVLGLDRYSDRQWQQLEQAAQPPRDLFSPPAPAGETPHSSATPPAAPPDPVHTYARGPAGVRGKATPEPSPPTHGMTPHRWT